MYEKYMIEALNEAKLALEEGEIPVGAVIVYKNKIIAKAHNTRAQENCILGHAEINAIKKTNKILENWRLCDCTLYVTLLPCPMCASAVNQSRIQQVICGTVPNNSNYSLIYQILSDNNYGKPVQLLTGVLEEECREILQKFFLEKRN